MGMEVILQHAGKRYGREVIFQDVDRTFTSGSHTAILGPNGSGKSTFLQLIAGAINPTSGSVEHRMAGGPVPADQVYAYVSIASPYLNLYDELRLSEVIAFHMRAKPLRPGIGAVDVAEIAYLDHAMEKPVLQFSSGMRQRLKLALAILSDTPLLLLDEPTSNLDAQAISWYRELLLRHLGGRTLFIASNRQPQEYDMCEAVIDMESFKTSGQ